MKPQKNWKDVFLKKGQSFRSRVVEKKLKITIALTALVVVSLLSIGAYQSGQGYQVTFNGQEIGVVRTQNQFIEILDRVNEEIISNKGEDTTFPQKISFDKIRAGKEKLSLEEDLKKAIYQNITLRTTAATINVNGEEIVSVKTLQEAEEILEIMKEPYSKQKDNVEIKEVSFEDKVEIKEIEISLDKILSKEEALAYLQQGTDEIESYEIATGDTTWGISRQFKLGLREIEVANPDVNLEKLHPGDTINLTVVKPVIDVKTIQEVVYNEKIPFEKTYKEDKNIYKGQQKVINEGKYGTMEITAEVIFQNGIESSRKIVEEKRVKEPTTEVIAKGTKPTQGSGAFRRPASGRTGARGVFGVARSGGRRHTGIDITNGSGTPIYAADTGTVTSYIGYRGGYGYVVELNHGGGYTTRYAHLSKILVNPGQRIDKGQQIGKMGSTGNSTGPHLHFEIRRNGTPLNPFKFISR